MMGSFPNPPPPPHSALMLKWLPDYLTSRKDGHVPASSLVIYQTGRQHSRPPCQSINFWNFKSLSNNSYFFVIYIFWVCESRYFEHIPMPRETYERKTWTCHSDVSGGGGTWRDALTFVKLLPVWRGTGSHLLKSHPRWDESWA